MTRLPCSCCSTVDYAKYVQRYRKADGTIGLKRFTYCILCAREKRRVIAARRYEKNLVYQNEWRKKNKDKVNECRRSYRLRNKDKVNEYKRRWYANTKRDSRN
jgi:hypothetical protein